MADVAACVTGLERTLLSLPVVASYDRHLVRAHETAGDSLDTFIVVLGNWTSAINNLRADVAAAYNAVRVVLMQARSLSAEPVHGRCSLSDRRYMDAYGSATQWLGVRRCYAEVQAQERSRGRQYAWLYRLRSDIVLLQDSPLASLRFAPSGVRARALRSAYVPLGGMSAAEHYSW